VPVRDVVAAKDAAPARVTPAAAIKQAVDLYAPVISRALPSHVSPERFASTILTACRNSPELMRCDPASVVAAAIRAAQLGIEPNDERGLCYLIPRAGKATFQLGYKGMAELGRRSGEVRRVVARTVYEADEFEYEYGTFAEGIKHKPAQAERGKSIYWYAIAWGPAGDVLDFVVLNREDVEYHRSFSAQPNGQMWAKSYDAAARKTAVRELFKLLPQSPEYASAVAADERSYSVGDIDVEPDDEPENIGEAVPREHIAIESEATELVPPDAA
jgi:recombination protein RecT